MAKANTFEEDAAYNATAKESLIVKYVAFGRIILYNSIRYK